MNTRTHDIEQLEQSLSEAKTDKEYEHRKAMLYRIYEASKDAYLEKMRTNLIGVLTDLETLTTQIGNEAMKYHPKALELWERYAQIRDAIQAYAKSQTYRQAQAKAASQVSKHEKKRLITDMGAGNA